MKELQKKKPLIPQHKERKIERKRTRKKERRKRKRKKKKITKKKRNNKTLYTFIKGGRKRGGEERMQLVCLEVESGGAQKEEVQNEKEEVTK